MKVIKAKKKSIRETRLRKGLTQRRLADKAEITQSTVFSLENKEVNPSPTTVKKVCEALDVEFDEVFEVVDKEVD